MDQKITGTDQTILDHFQLYNSGEIAAFNLGIHHVRMFEVKGKSDLKFHMILSSDMRFMAMS